MRRHVLLALALAGCASEPPDLTGTYQITAQPPGAPPYDTIEFRRHDEDTWLFLLCTTDCSMGYPPSYGRDDDTHFSGTMSSGFPFDATRCSLTHIVGAVELAGERVTITATDHNVVTAVESCTGDEALRRGTSMPVVGVRVYEAVRVEDMP